MSTSDIKYGLICPDHSPQFLYSSMSMWQRRIKAPRLLRWCEKRLLEGNSAMESFNIEGLSNNSGRHTDSNQVGKGGIG